MKNVYSMLLLTTAMTIASGVTAQNKQDGPARSPRLLASGAVAHAATPSQMRGGGPVNDGCAGVTFEALAAGASLTFSGDNTGATEAGDFEAGSGLEGFGAVVWHGFTTTACTNLALQYCGQDPAWQNLAAFLARTCPATDADYVTYSSGNFTECGDGNATIYFNGVEAGSYYLPVLLDDSASAVGPYTIVLSATACATPPTNDGCAGTIVLTASTTCIGTPFTTAGATQDLDPIECNGWTSSNANDVYFSFVATATEMTVGVVGSDYSDAVIELFEGACGSLNSLGCADDTYPTTSPDVPVAAEQLIHSGFTVGTTYIVRVYDYAHASTGHNFEICVTEGAGNNIGIEENTPVSFSLYPNPGTGVFNLNYSGASGLANIEVMDVTGRTVRSERVRVTNGAVLPLDLGGVATGNYNVRLTVNGTRTEQRLMVK